MNGNLQLTGEQLRGAKPRSPWLDLCSVAQQLRKPQTITLPQGLFPSTIPTPHLGFSWEQQPPATQSAGSSWARLARSGSTPPGSTECHQGANAAKPPGNARPLSATLRAQHPSCPTGKGSLDVCSQMKTRKSAVYSKTQPTVFFLAHLGSNSNLSLKKKKKGDRKTPGGGEKRGPAQQEGVVLMSNWETREPRWWLTPRGQQNWCWLSRPGTPLPTQAASECWGILQGAADTCTKSFPVLTATSTLIIAIT